MERLTISGSKEARSGVTIRETLYKLAKYEDLEEQGLLLRLPCRIGDTIYVIYDGELHSSSIIKIIINENAVPFFEWDLTCARWQSKNGFVMREFGKTVFLIKEEGEAKLKELGKNNDL